MAHKIIITPFAQNDEGEAYTWYEEQRAGLGEELLKELKLLIKKFPIIQNTTVFIDERKVLRDFLIHRFPYLINYRIKNDVVEIIAVHHAKKHPLKKYGDSEK